MRASCGLLWALLVFGCATTPGPPPMPASMPLGISMMPPAVDVGALLPPIPPVVVEPIGKRHEPVPIDGGKYCPADTPQDCASIPPGILVDDTSFAQAGADAAGNKRLRVELAVVRRLFDKTREQVEIAETAYQRRIVELRHENLRLRTHGWWDRNRFAVGVGLGFAASLATVYAAAQALE